MLCVIPLTVILCRLESAYHFSSSEKRINHLRFMDNLKLYAKNERGLESIVQIIWEFGVDRCATLVLKIE